METTVVIFDKGTREVLAALRVGGRKALCKKGVGFATFNGSEPVFADDGGRLTLRKDACILMPQE